MTRIALLSLSVAILFASIGCWVYFLTFFLLWNFVFGDDGLPQANGIAIGISLVAAFAGSSVYSFLAVTRKHSSGSVIQTISIACVSLLVVGYLFWR